MAMDMAKFLARFVEEARDHLSRLNEGLVRLENHPGEDETINAVFRSAHTIKGSSRMMKLLAITEVAHKVEDALGQLREKKLGFSKELGDVLFKGTDCIAAMIEQVAAGQPIVADTAELCEELAKAAEGRFEKRTPPAVSPVGQEVLPDAAVAGTKAGPAVPAKSKASETIRINAEKLDELIRLMGEVVSNQNRVKGTLADVRELETAAKHLAEVASRLDDDHPHRQAGSHRVAQSGRSLHLRLKQLASKMRDDINLQELLTAELQERALMLRMVPLSTVFDSLQRTTRDIARSKGKEVELVVEGGEVEIDKKIIEKIGDPLLHMLRNAIDHGIEAPDDRRMAGKREQGTLRLSASNDAGSVLIELADDGGGLPLEKIREKALRKKMFAEEDLNAMSEAELIDLIFQPGLSTSPIITDLSGRGVGMDVVKKNVVEELKGSIKVTSKKGHGTRFSIRLPMTLAVMRVLLFSASNVTFAVNTRYVSEIVRVAESEIITVLNKKAIRLREQLIPLADLQTLLRLPDHHGVKKDNALLLLVHIGSEQLGLIIDILLDEEDMVIKALPAHMRSVRLVSGVAISAKNEVINILHVPEIIKAASEASVAHGPAPEQRAEARILVVDDSVNTREIEKSILEAYGYKVDLAEDGVDAIERSRSATYDLIITDVEMPRLDGFSLTERLRKDGSYQYTPIIIVTSREKEEDKRRGIAVGASAYIVKGAFDQSNLLETVQNLIGGGKIPA